VEEYSHVCMVCHWSKTMSNVLMGNGILSCIRTQSFSLDEFYVIQYNLRQKQNYKTWGIFAIVITNYKNYCRICLIIFLLIFVGRRKMFYGAGTSSYRTSVCLHGNIWSCLLQPSCIAPYDVTNWTPPRCTVIHFSRSNGQEIPTFTREGV
jgi:hypothetical protein